MRVSIVIDNYNYEAYVAQAIESALAQDWPDLEVIVVDDGSPDGSVAVIRRYEGRVQVIAKPNEGQGSAYNAGFARATGDLVFFLDADDWLYPQAVREVAARWRPGVSKVQFRLDMVDRDGRPVGRQLPRDMHDTDAAAVLRAFGTYGSPPGSGNAYDAAYLRRVLPMDAPAWRIGADSVPVLLAPLHGEVVSVPQALGAYRLHKPLDDGALFFGNSSASLVAEHERMLACKRLVEGELARLGQAAKEPLSMAPWEARTLALCLRFGGAPMAARLKAERSAWAHLKRALASLWRWPAFTPSRRMAVMVWVLAVLWLPLPLAHRVAQMHRQSVGLRQAAVVVVPAAAYVSAELSEPSR